MGSYFIIIPVNQFFSGSLRKYRKYSFDEIMSWESSVSPVDTDVVKTRRTKTDFALGIAICGVQLP